MSNQEQSDPLDQEVLKALSEEYEMNTDKLQGSVNESRAEKSFLRHMKLGWLTGVSRKRLNASLDRLVTSGDINRDTRLAVINILGSTHMDDVDHYKKVTKNGQDRSKQQSV
jgi:hypothetical protein